VCQNRQKSMTGTSPDCLRPFANAEEFLVESGLLEKWTNEGIQCALRSAMANAGFRLDRTERIFDHRLTILLGSRAIPEEPRKTRHIRRAVVRSFRQGGFGVRSDLVSVYWGRTRVRVHVGLLEPA
jgi:hypothetical protein